MTGLAGPPPRLLVWAGRLGKAFLYLARPRLFAAKLRSHLRRRRRFYRNALARGLFLIEPEGVPAGVLFTVAMPVFRVAEEHLRAAIASVEAQTHANWELVCVDDASPDPHVRRVLDDAARRDRRIRVIHRAENGGIAVASNQAIAAARGDFIAFLDHDDLLHPRALELAARFLAAHPETDWLFTDEDKVDAGGRHHEPCLKPGWSRHLLLSFNYVCHLRVVRKAMLDRVGGHRAGFDGAQDYDLALRVLAAGGRFAHLPGILYHWRTVATSMARAAAAKPAAHQHALRALAEHAGTFGRGGAVSAEVLLAPASFFHVRRAPARDLTVAMLVPDAGDGSAAAAPPSRVELVPTGADVPSADDVVAAAHGTGADVLVVEPEGGIGQCDLDELLALLQVPGTALVAGRWLAGRRVAASGWLLGDDGSPFDPWAGLAASDPGYLNLALVPGPRLVPPATGWVAWRGPLLAAWDTAEDVPVQWRLFVGWSRLGMEVVTTPTVSFAGQAAGIAPPGPAPAGLPVTRVSWLEELGLLPRQARILVEEA